jgi:hypothetical protein
VAVEDRFDLFVASGDLEELIDIDKIAVVVFERVMNEDRDRTILGQWEIGRNVR